MLQREHGDISEEYQLFQDAIRILCKDEVVLSVLGTSETLSSLELDFYVWGGGGDEGQ